MPAIHPPRLRQQVEELVVQYADAERFSRLLKDLFTYYGEQTKRSDQQAKQAISLPGANVPLPVLREVANQMAPYAENAPHAVLNLCQTLWQQPLMDSRQLAAMLIGKLPVSQLDQSLELTGIDSPLHCVTDGLQEILHHLGELLVVVADDHTRHYPLLIAPPYHIDSALFNASTSAPHRAPGSIGSEPQPKRTKSWFTGDASLVGTGIRPDQG